MLFLEAAEGGSECAPSWYQFQGLTCIPSLPLASQQPELLLNTIV